MAQEALELVRLRNNFYRDSYRRLVTMMFVSLLIIAGLVSTILILVYTRPSPKYFAATDSGRIIPLIPLEQPNLTDVSILQWATKSVLAVYTYNFVNYREVFQKNRSLFTPLGWQNFLNAINSARNLKTVEEKKLVLSAVVASAPIVLSEYVQQGRYTWKVQIPVMVTYQSLSEVFHDNLLVTLTIERVSTLDSVDGVGIAEFVAQNQ